LYFDNTLALGILAAGYLPVIFLLKHWMKDRPPLKGEISNRLLGTWNLFLGISSAVGAYYTLPYLWQDIQTHGFTNSVCQGNYSYHDLTSHIVILFNLSKFLEFVDTLFIVFRKADLAFLHYYHHILTCLYCWNGGYLQISTGVYFASVNLFIHAIMYSYFALLAFNIRVLYPYKKNITFLQTAQMCLGTIVICTWFKNCADTSSANFFLRPYFLNHVVGLLMYISYGFLFTLQLIKGRKKIE
jgi:hypothetical protein